MYDTTKTCSVALVLPLPDPQVPEQHEPCCILCKKPSGWKFNSMQHLRCRLHHYYKPKADCILLNRREWILMRIKKKTKLVFRKRGSACLQANLRRQKKKSSRHSHWNFKFWSRELNWEFLKFVLRLRPFSLR